LEILPFAPLGRRKRNLKTSIWGGKFLLNIFFTSADAIWGGVAKV
jgi:hypothetical protein